MNNNSILPIPDRDRLLLAYACAEWSGALTHLHALRQVGCRVSDEVVGQVTDELNSFAALWCVVHLEVWTVEESVEHARAWLTEHVQELDEVLNKQGVKQ